MNNKTETVLQISSHMLLVLFSCRDRQTVTDGKRDRQTNRQRNKKEKKKNEKKKKKKQI